MSKESLIEFIGIELGWGIFLSVLAFAFAILVNMTFFWILAVVILVFFTAIVLYECKLYKKTYITLPPETFAATGSINGHDYVDLGLSVKWATCNIGATAPNQLGDRYAWGEIDYKDEFSFDNYKWSEGINNSLTKYNFQRKYGTVDKKSTLNLKDDIARVEWGKSWRMPTYAEWEELINNCTLIMLELDGRKGLWITSNKEGYANRSIFLPCHGYIEHHFLNDNGNIYYWTSQLDTENSRNAYIVRGMESVKILGFERCRGICVRSVCP